MHFDIVKIIREMDIFATAVVVTLLLMAMSSMAVFFERVWVFWRSRRHSQRFAHAASDILERRAHEELIAVAEKNRASHLAGLLATGVKAFKNGVDKPGQLPP